MYSIRHLGHEVEFEEKYRPDQIRVDGKDMSMSLHMDRHGWSWRTSASGNLLSYEAEDGSGITIPQKKFMAAKEKQTDRLNVRIAPTVKDMLAELAEKDGRTMSNYIEKLIKEAYEGRN